MKIKVAVFAERKKRGNGLKLNAYTMWYNPQWPGCNMVEVEAKNGTEAKKELFN